MAPELGSVGCSSITDDSNIHFIMCEVYSNINKLQYLTNISRILLAAQYEDKHSRGYKHLIF